MSLCFLLILETEVHFEGCSIVCLACNPKLNGADLLQAWLVFTQRVFVLCNISFQTKCGLLEWQEPERPMPLLVF